MSKAFTRDDDGAGFLPPPVRPRARARLTAYGARLLRETAANALLEGAEIVSPAGGDVVALGAPVRFRGDRGEREVVLVTADEVGHVPHGVGIAAPLARALLGTRVGDAVEGPREEELTVLALDWPT